MSKENNKTTRPKIVVVGSSNTDMIIKINRIPRPGETVSGGTFSTAAGGKGANQAVAAQRLGAYVTLVTALGQDPLGDQALQNFIAEGIDVRHVHRDATAASGVAFIIVDANGENSIAVAAGANSRLSPAQVESAIDAIMAADILLLQLEIPIAAVLRAIEISREKGTLIILNPAPAPDFVIPDSLLAKVDLLTPNEWEAQALTGVAVHDEASAHQAGQRLRSKGAATVLITMGAQGVWMETPDEARRIAAYSVSAIDTTAAGDVFNAGLAVALAENKSLVEAVRFANAAAAISVTRLGAQPSAPNREEVERWLGEAAVKG